MQQNIILHYSHGTNYFGSSGDALQSTFLSASVNLLDVVLLAFLDLQKNKPRGFVFLEEFSKICPLHDGVCIPSAEHYRAAAIVHASVRRSLINALEPLSGKANQISFNLSYYVFGINKQSLAVAFFYV